MEHHVRRIGKRRAYGLHLQTSGSISMNFAKLAVQLQGFFVCVNWTSAVVILKVLEEKRFITQCVVANRKEEILTRLTEEGEPRRGNLHGEGLMESVWRITRPKILAKRLL